MLKRLIICSAAFAAIALSACTQVQTDKIDIAIQKNLPQTCKLIETAHGTFTAVTTVKPVKESVVKKENAAYDGIRVLCADPGSVTASNALVLVAQAYVVVTQALKEADRA